MAEFGSVKGVDPVMVKVLVVDGKLLEFDLLLRMNAIKVLSRVHINDTGELTSPISASTLTSRSVC